VNFKVIFLNTIVFAFEAQYRGWMGFHLWDLSWSPMSVLG
jgi:hypothetical protein